jgi:parallel beta-helix repeat protein
MKPIFADRTLLKIFSVFLALGLNLVVVFTACADTPLNTNNLVDNGGRPYWLINSPGNYYLDIQGESFYTSNFFAIRIQCSNVTLDGRGKTITGSGRPSSPSGSDNICGVLVNSGPRTYNVHVKNINVEKKYYGILFEWIYNGKVENCNTSGNSDGITLWKSEMTTLEGNIAKNNLNGIVLDANECINKNNTLKNNITNNNSLTGIILHLENSYNYLIDNIANENGHFGITLPSGSHDNILSGNTTDNNYCAGINLQNSDNNRIEGNYMRNNGDRGLWLLSSNKNNIYNNYFNNPDDNVTFGGSNIGNQWNAVLTDLTEGTNILGGPFLGGNFWAGPQGTGFSQVAEDSDRDGICDSPYTISNGNVDQYPLKAPEVVLTAVPSVRTEDVSSITCNSASSGGEIISDGGASVTARGVCWSTSENPTINDSHTSDGTGAEAFESGITGLEPGTKYYLRAYAANSAGTGYGDVLPFTTESFEGILYVSPNDQKCGGNCPCFDTIQAAIDSPYTAHTLKMIQGTYDENFTLNEEKHVILTGGWDASFTNQIPNETIIKAPSINAGSLTLQNLIIAP